jgi:hypothetical protein
MIDYPRTNVKYFSRWFGKDISNGRENIVGGTQMNYSGNAHHRQCSNIALLGGCICVRWLISFSIAIVGREQPPLKREEPTYLYIAAHGSIP